MWELLLSNPCLQAADNSVDSVTIQPTVVLTTTSRIPDNTSCIPDHTSQIPDNTSCNPDDAMAEARFAADYSKRVSNCKKCKSKIEKGELRMAKIVPNFFHDGDGEMKQYHHPRCIFETFIKARSTTKIIEEADNIEGFTDLQQDDKDMLNQLIKGNCIPRTNVLGGGGGGGYGLVVVTPPHLQTDCFHIYAEYIYIY